MVKKRTKSGSDDKRIELLQDLLILELGKAGISQPEVRKIVGVDIHRVSRILKHLKKQHA